MYLTTPLDTFSTNSTILSLTSQSSCLLWSWGPPVPLGSCSSSALPLVFFLCPVAQVPTIAHHSGTALICPNVADVPCLLDSISLLVIMGLSHSLTHLFIHCHFMGFGREHGFKPLCVIGNPREVWVKSIDYSSGSDLVQSLHWKEMQIKKKDLPTLNCSCISEVPKRQASEQIFWDVPVWNWSVWVEDSDRTTALVLVRRRVTPTQAARRVPHWQVMIGEVTGFPKRERHRHTAPEWKGPSGWPALSALLPHTRGHLQLWQHPSTGAGKETKAITTCRADSQKVQLALKPCVSHLCLLPMNQSMGPAYLLPLLWPIVSRGLPASSHLPWFCWHILTGDGHGREHTGPPQKMVGWALLISGADRYPPRPKALSEWGHKLLSGS